MTKNKVIFRKFSKEDSYNSSSGDVIAIFPDDSYGSNGLVWSYMHVGQHGSCSLELIKNIEPASPEEYKDLLEELQSIGYDLRVCKRLHR